MKTKKLELKKEVIASLSNEGMSHVLGGDFLTGRNTIGACAPVTHNGAGCCSGYCKPYSQEMTCETCENTCVNKDTLYCKTIEKVCQVVLTDPGYVALTYEEGCELLVAQ